MFKRISSLSADGLEVVGVQHNGDGAHTGIVINEKTKWLYKLLPFSEATILSPTRKKKVPKKCIS